MKGKKLIRNLGLRNFLSFGEEMRSIELEPLNVLIGPNGSGKSNIIESLSLLRATPKDLAVPIREGGGVGEWLWKGAKETPVAIIEVVVPYVKFSLSLRYRLSFSMYGPRLELVDEVVEEERKRNPTDQEPLSYYRYQMGRPVLSARAVQADPSVPSRQRQDHHLQKEDLKLDQSILSQKVDRDQFPELTYLGEQFGGIYLFRDIHLGRGTGPRKAQQTNLPEDFLLDDASNLNLVLNDMEHRGLKPKILALLQKFYFAAADFTIKIYGGTAQLFLHERGLTSPIPASRLSDGTIRFLCLIALLCHPSPPPLLCIEEPEVGLHPDIMLTIAGMLVDASQRTQLIVTTHSAELVSALSDTPEAVLVCEHDETGSHLRRLDPARLEKWLEDYSLGELWRSGEIGGNRW